ncbi:unnamed protein product [Prunus armeniaca]|uniref:Uncharacterized protein n=1 Tax=Prunus armeniaca TaxID=36596 RepID=A0A6J5XEN6_PRUAR|nr:unnamed protein product [Prunus armeniaca]
MHLSCESPLHDQHSACRSAGVTSRGSCEQVTRQGAKGLEGTEYTRLGCRRTRCRGHDGAEGTRLAYHKTRCRMARKGHEIWHSVKGICIKLVCCKKNCQMTWNLGKVPKAFACCKKITERHETWKDSECHGVLKTFA